MLRCPSLPGSVARSGSRNTSWQAAVRLGHSKIILPAGFRTRTHSLTTSRTSQRQKCSTTWTAKISSAKLSSKTDSSLTSALMSGLLPARSSTMSTLVYPSSILSPQPRFKRVKVAMTKFFCWCAFILVYVTLSGYKDCVGIFLKQEGQIGKFPNRILDRKLMAKIDEQIQLATNK